MVEQLKFEDGGGLLKFQLTAAPWLGPDTPILSIKKNKNTDVGHYGEMASWQMRGTPF